MDKIKGFAKKSSAIELCNLSFRFANESPPVLKNINLTLQYGEIMVLGGLSGEGKSTLVSMISGILPHMMGGIAEGQVHLDGQDVTNLKPGERSRYLGSVLQNAENQIIHQKVEDELAFGCENRNFSPEIIEEEIHEKAGLLHLNLSSQTRKLSGGEMQRVITAAILCMKQRILLFDEPFAHLDFDGMKTLLSLLNRLKNKGYAILIVEHRIEEIFDQVDRTAWLEQGNLEVFEEKKEILKHLPVFQTYRRTGQFLNPLIVFQNVTMELDRHEALNDVDLTLYHGERLMILGDNGSGKTTLLKVMGRLLKPTGGRVCVKGINEKEWFNQVGMIFQNPNYQLFMPTVYEEIALKGKGEKLIREIIEAFQLKELLDRHPQSLSEGQKRRLTIAAVMAMDPEIVLLDEPTVGQDGRGLEMIAEYLLKQNREKQITIVTATHDQRWAKSMADRILWIKDGSVHKVGNAALGDNFFRQTEKNRE